MRTQPPLQRIDASAVRRLLNPYNLSHLPIGDVHHKEVRSPEMLVSARRYDVAAKSILARSHVRSASLGWAEEVYAQHLRCFGNYKEGDGSGKQGLGEYRKRFGQLIESIGSDGFDDDISCVPVDRNGVLIDGAHRHAICLVYRRPLSVISFDVDAVVYDYRYFQDRGMPTTMLDAMAFEYCSYHRSFFVAVLFPRAYPFFDEAREILGRAGSIFFEKEIALSSSGRRNLIRLLYKGEPWIGEGKQITRGLLYHSNERFCGKNCVRCIFIDDTDVLRMREAKEEIRRLCGGGNDAAHINDEVDEAMRVAEIVLNDNGVHFLNHADFGSLEEGESKLMAYRRAIATSGRDIEDFCVDGGYVLAAYGLRATADLDYLHVGPALSVAPQEGIDSHNGELYSPDTSLADCLFDPRYHFRYEGLKYSALPSLRERKRLRAEPKDRRDLLLIDSLSRKSAGDAGRYWRMLCQYSCFVRRGGFSFLAYQLCKRLPGPVVRMIKCVRSVSTFVAEWLGPYHRTIRYRGYELHYTRGTSLIHALRGGMTYEPELTYRLIELLRRKDHPIFVDVGANIGLITLNVLSALPTTMVYAFEPGLHQYTLFQKTIMANHLESAVQLFDVALGRRQGCADFFVHATHHSSGDGFRDTNRAGWTKRVQVKVDSFDGWWKVKGFPHIDVVKIDAEGAELLVLEGAQHMLRRCRSAIVFEMCSKNLIAYPHCPGDILRCLEGASYTVTTIGGVLVSADNVDKVVCSCESFLALPQNGEVKP